jgi:hypothetical protein
MPFNCPNFYPYLWDTVKDKFPIARALIDAAKQKGMDGSTIELMEQELQNAEDAQKICYLEKAEIHLDWIIMKAPEPYMLVAILLIPLCRAWRRTRRTRRTRTPA